MQLEYIQKDHPDLPDDIVVIDALDLREAFFNAVQVLQSRTPKLVVWNGAQKLYTPAEQAAIQHSTQHLDASMVKIEKARYKPYKMPSLNALSLSGHFNRVADFGQMPDQDEIANNAIKRIITNIQSAATGHSPIKRAELYSLLNFVYDTAYWHNDDAKHPNDLLVFNSYGDAANTVFIPDDSIGIRFDDKDLYYIKENAPYAWMMMPWSIAFMPPTTRGGMVHTTPSMDLDPENISINDNRRLEVLALKTKEQLFPLR